jgi:hypothetical protein
LSNRGQFSFDPFTKLGGGEANMSLSEKVGPLLAARAATDPDAAKLLEMFTKAEKMLNESSIARIGGGAGQSLASWSDEWGNAL